MQVAVNATVRGAIKFGITRSALSLSATGNVLTSAPTQRPVAFTVPPRRIHAQGADSGLSPSKAKNPCYFRGRGPRTPAVLGCCALFVRNFPVCAGGLAAFCPSFAAGDKGSVATLPASRPCALALFGLLPPCPLRRFALGGGVGGLSLLPCGPLPAGRWISQFGIVISARSTSKHAVA
jgi:hypothetical protein